MVAKHKSDRAKGAWTICSLRTFDLTRMFTMNAPGSRGPSWVVAAIFGILDPLVYGMFAGGLIFDALYLGTGVILWNHAAAWLITLGLFIAILPRIINLVHVWITGRIRTTRGDYVDFWLNFFAILVAVFNALVHSRDAFATMPSGFWLSFVTVLLLVTSHALRAVRAANGGV
jgi:uncharacterized membrane protein